MPESPHVSVTTIDREECERLLATGQVGRLAVVRDGAPHIIPVNYAVGDLGAIVFRTDPGTLATEAALRQVAFEVDEIDPVTHTGWSVVVHGHGLDIARAIDPESVRLRQLPLATWAPGERSRWFKVLPTEITGRRLSPA